MRGTLESSLNTLVKFKAKKGTSMMRAAGEGEIAVAVPRLLPAIMGMGGQLVGGAGVIIERGSETEAENRRF